MDREQIIQEQANEEHAPQGPMGPEGPEGPESRGSKGRGPKGPMGPRGRGPKGPMGPRGRGPMGPMGPGMRPEEMFIMPDFIPWRNAFFKLDCFFVILTFLMEFCSMFIVYKDNWTVGLSAGYLVPVVIIPSGINLLLLFLLINVRRKLPKDNTEMRQNIFPVFIMLFLCINVSISHANLTVLMSLYCVPIFMSTLFSQKMICRLIAIISYIGAMIASVRHVLSTDGVFARLDVFLESLLVLILLFAVTHVALALLGMTDGQKNKLMNYAEDIKEEQRRAEAASYAKSVFLANMSHEIRTPINAILGMNEMVLRESTDAQITEYAENIYSASTSLLHLINDVLDISKIESGKLEIMVNSYDTASFIHDCCNMITERAAKKNLSFNVYCNPNLPSLLRGDEIHLRQIVTNFLSNAAKYTEKGSITFSVDGRTDDGKFSLAISVKDTGMGIREEDIEKLFSQFTRLDMDKNRNIEGTGLGLSIAKQLIDLMEGTINVESTYGEGSTFTVVIPQVVIDNTPMGNFHERYHEVSSQNKHYKKGFEAPDAKILVVDDVQVNLKVASNLLKQTKIFVDTANSGMLCLEKIVETKYDIIFMDHMMPEMNGIETYQKMQEMEDSLNKDTPVIMLTANAITGVKDNYLKIGFSDYLSKPILGDKLEQMIQKYLPEDKIVFTTAEPAATPQEEEDSPIKVSLTKRKNLVRLQKLYQEHPDIDILHGMSFCDMNSNIYISILHLFCSRIKIEPLDTAFQNKDLHAYEVITHDIRRAAEDTGFVSLSQKATALEGAAQMSDWDYIRTEHSSFVRECQLITNTIRQDLDRRKT